MVAHMTTTRDKWLSPKQAAHELNTTPAVIRRSIQRGEIPCLRLSARTFRIPASALKARS
jgi:excisionase family DNA binding protein